MTAVRLTDTSPLEAEAERLYEELRVKLHDVVPDVELWYKARLAAEILALKEERNALILGHNYMEPALYYSIPDFTGDSLALTARQPRRTRT